MSTTTGPILGHAWEPVSPGVNRLTVPGGWLYRAGDTPPLFVPDPEEIVRRVTGLGQSPDPDRRGPHGGRLVELELPAEADAMVLAVLVTATQKQAGCDLHVSLRPNANAAPDVITTGLKLVQEALAPKGGH